MPTSLQEAGISPIAHHEEGELAIVSEGVVALTLPSLPAVEGRQLYFLPQVTRDAISWSCVSPDIVRVADTVPGCRYAAGYAPSVVTSEELEAKLRPPGTVTVKTGLGNWQLNPQILISGNAWSLSGSRFPELSEADRAAVLAGAARSVTGRLDNLDRVRNYARWLVTGGSAARALLEQEIAEGPPDVASAALLALCDFDRTLPDASGSLDDCLVAPRAGSGPAIDRLVSLATLSLENPAQGFMYSGGGVLDCRAAAVLLGALGPHARPAVEPLGRLLDESRPRVSADGPNVCPLRPVAVAALKILLTPPRDTAHAALADRATLALIQTALLDPPDRGAAPMLRLAKLLDSRPLRPSLRRQLDRMATQWVTSCRNLSYDAPKFVGQLGRLGFDVLGALRDRDTDDGCLMHSTLIGSLAPLVAAYPEQTRPRYEATHSAYARDDFITVAQEVLAAEEPSARTARTRRTLRAFLDSTGFVPVKFRDTNVVFPKRTGLRWAPQGDWSIPVTPSPDAVRKDLRAAYEEFAAAHPKCDVPTSDEAAWRSIEKAKRLFVFPCEDDDYRLIVIGSPEGFKKMKFPERLSDMRIDATIVAVGDADGDGNMEVLASIPCGGHNRDCTEGDITGFEFFEEDGEWFTWFRAP